MDRLGLGYSFEALRAKFLFTEGAHAHKNRRPRFERRETAQPKPGPGLVNIEGVDSFAVPPPPKPHRVGEKSTQHEYGEKNYGADISTLTRFELYNRLIVVINASL